MNGSKLLPWLAEQKIVNYSDSIDSQTVVITGQILSTFMNATGS